VGIVFLWRIWVFTQQFDLVNTNALARTDLRLDVFLVPCVMAILLRDPAWQRRAERIRPIHCVALVALLGLMKAYKGTSATFTSFELLFQSCVFPIIIIYTVFHSASWAGRFLELKPLRWIGRISYSIYLWQQIFVQPSWISSHLTFVPLRLACLLVMASLSYYLVELPMVRLGRRLGRGDSAARAQVLMVQPPQTETISS